MKESCWFYYKSLDKKVKGYCKSRSISGVAKFAGYNKKDLVVKPVFWNGREFTGNEKSSGY